MRSCRAPACCNAPRGEGRILTQEIAGRRLLAQQRVDRGPVYSRQRAHLVQLHLALTLLDRNQRRPRYADGVRRLLLLQLCGVAGDSQPLANVVGAEFVERGGHDTAMLRCRMNEAGASALRNARHSASC